MTAASEERSFEVQPGRVRTKRCQSGPDLRGRRQVQLHLVNQPGPRLLLAVVLSDDFQTLALNLTTTR